jgi:hypothetical protein
MSIPPFSLKNQIFHSPKLGGIGGNGMEFNAILIKISIMPFIFYKSPIIPLLLLLVLLIVIL